VTDSTDDLPAAAAPDAADAVLARTVRAEAASIVASLTRFLGNLDVAEEAVQEAIVEALTEWRRDGIPQRPGGWLATAARRNALDRLRRDARYRQKLALLKEAPMYDDQPVARPDDRLELLFACCHPALPAEGRLALTLRAVVGLTTAEIARAFLTAESTVAQRIVRTKRKIVDTAIPLRVPEDDELPDRLDGVLTVVYLAYNEAFLTTAGQQASRRDLADDAIWLATLVATSLPREPEALGLLALLVLQHARADARIADDSRLVLLRDQDRSRWDTAAITDGVRLLGRAAKLRRPGRFQLQAAIAACHAEAPSWAATDWPQILALYDLLARHDRSPVVALNRAVALAHVEGPAAALAAVDALVPALDGYHLLHATRGELLRSLGRPAEARAADERAQALTRNRAEQALLADRIARGPA
jgi:RNA polymerase sigma factor (sigma-70 family)